MTHLIGIVIVVIQSWLRIVCPLTTLEMWLRQQAGAVTYSESFIEYWLQKILYWQFPWWVFIVLYTLFASLILATWFLVPPSSKKELTN